MNQKILVVDGKKEYRNKYQNELKQVGYDVITASCGKTALDKLKQEAIDLIVLDLVLPDCQGFEYLEKFVTTNRNVKVVINTEDASYKRDFHSWAADAFLTKSSDLSELKQTINTVLKAN